jgi:hypothetical protein
MHISKQTSQIEVWSAGKQANRSKQARSKCEAQASKQASCAYRSRQSRTKYEAQASKQIEEADKPDRSAKRRKARRQAKQSR